MENDILNKWLNIIPNKKIIKIKLDNDIINIFNKITTLNYIISFDVEFMRFVIKNEQVKTINEMGGIIFMKVNNDWYLDSIFHFNLLPLVKNISQYYLLTSEYNTLSKKTYQKIIKNEKLLLPEYKINKKNYKNLLLTDPIINLYLKPSQIDILKNDNYDNVKKKIEKIKYNIKGYDLIKLPKIYKLFTKNINLILNDTDVKSRQILEHKKFIKLTNKLFSISYLIVKGLEDIKALKTHTLLLKQYSNNIINLFDIAKYNTILFNKCDSAKLENTYICLDKINLLNDYIKYYNIINDFTDMKAHNPLVDAYYTFIIFIVFASKKILYDKKLLLPTINKII